jgi:hypothetical protein
MNSALWVVIEIGETFKIPINRANSNLFEPDFGNDIDLFGRNQQTFPFGFKIPFNEPYPSFEPPNLIRGPVENRPFPDIRLVGIYTSKESAQNMIFGYPQRKILGPTIAKQ